MYTVVKRLINQGWAVKGSSNGTTAGMDATDRWSTATDAGTRGTTTTTPVSWFCLTDANSIDILFSFVAATDDQWRFSADFSGAYAAAGTATHTPTSASEIAINSFFTSASPQNPTIVGTTASGDRVVSIWTRPDSKGFRVAVASGGTWKSLWGLEPYTQNALGSGVTVSPSAGFYVNSPSGFAESTTLLNPNSGSTSSVQFRFVTRRTDTGTNLALARGLEVFGGEGASATTLILSNIAPELHGGTEYMMRRFSLGCGNTSHRGRIGTLIDWWQSRPGGTDGDVYGNREFVHFGGANFGMAWPWDGTPSVTGTSVTLT